MMTLDLHKFNKQIEESNARFEEATPEAKRVMIAEDVIQRIAIGQIIPSNYDGVATFGFYTNLGNIDFDAQCTIDDQIDNRKRISIKKTLDSGVQCTACAKGGLFVAYIGRVNQMTWASWANETGHTAASMKKLRKLFSEKQLAMIEGAFEGGVLVETNVFGKPMFTAVETDIIRKFRDVNKCVGSANRTLTLICENIIKNNGTFKLEGVSENYPE